MSTSKLITLKSIVDEINKKHKKSVTTKRVRVTLRRTFAASHDKNDAWVFDARQAAKVRAIVRQIAGVKEEKAKKEVVATPDANA